MQSRHMQLKDIAEVVAIEQAANNFPWTEKNFKDCLRAGYQAWVFSEQSEEILGFTIIQQVIDEVHLLNICVKPKVQGQGFGRQILNFVIEFTKQSSSVLIVLEVRSSNQRAQQLYLENGFNEMAVRRDYYPDKQGREDAILMGMDLSFIA